VRASWTLGSEETDDSHAEMFARDNAPLVEFGDAIWREENDDGRLATRRACFSSTVTMEDGAAGLEDEAPIMQLNFKGKAGST